MPQDKIDLSDFDELFYDGLEIIKTESGLPTKGVKRRIKENISLEDIKQYIRTKLSTEIKKAKRDVLECLPKKKMFTKAALPLTDKLIEWIVYAVREGDVNYIFYMLSHILTDYHNNIVDEIQEEINKLK